MVLLVVTYGCEGWTIKKAEHWRTDAFELWCWRRLLKCWVCRWNLLQLMFFELVMLSNHLILSRPFSFCLQSFPASGSFPRSQFFASGDQSTGASVPESVFPMNVQNWFCFRLTGWISLQSKGLSWVFPNTTVEKHQFFGAQSSFWSNSHIHTWLLEKSLLWLDGPLLAK